jgi:hypothetical protein
MKDWGSLAELLLESVGDEVAGRGCPMWVRVLDPADGAVEDDFALALSDDREGLLGWVATPDCQAVGLVATGRMRALPGAQPGVVDSAHDRFRMACLVARNGAVAWKVAVSDGVTAGLIGDTAPSEGRVLDCLRRCFSLPTPPPPASPARLQAIAWLAAVLDRASVAHRRLSWSEVSQLHPVAQALGTELGSPGARQLTGLLRVVGSAWTWEDYRQLAERNSDVEGVIDPKLAAWMDEGMFARWILSYLPAADELLAAVRPHLAPSAARRLTHAVRASGLPESAEAAM